MHLVSTLTLSRPLCRGVLQKLIDILEEEKVGKFRFSRRLDDWGHQHIEETLSGKKDHVCKALRYCWSNSFSYYNNILFSIEISSALFKRLVKSDQWIRCLKPESAIFWERQSPWRLITSTRVSSWVFIRHCQHIVPYIIFFNFFSKTFLSPTNLATISKFPRWVGNSLKTVFEKQPHSILPN